MFSLSTISSVGASNTINAKNNTTHNSFKFMTYNIEASGTNPSWFNVVKEEDPDIMILVETGNWDDNGNQTLNQVVSDLNTYFSNENPYEGYTDQNVPYSTSGVAILSRFDITKFNDIEYVTLDDSTIYNSSHDFVDAKINLGGTTIHVIGGHLKCCSGPDNEIKRNNAQEGIINYMDSLGNVPIIYAGDFNSFSPQDTSNSGDLGTGPMIC